MTQAALPDRWQELIAGHALGDLSPEEAEEFRRLLEAHPALAQEVTQLQEAMALLPYALPDVEPPPQLRSTLLAAAQTQPQFSTSAPRRATRGIHPRWWGVGGAIAAVLVGALALDNYQLRQQANDNQANDNQAIIDLLQQPNTQVYALAGTDNAVGASGSLVVNPDQTQLVIFVKNLPALPTGQAYRLWAMPNAGATPLYCGQFNTTLEAVATTTWTPPNSSCTAIAAQILLTAESTTAPPVPAGDLVMQSL